MTVVAKSRATHTALQENHLFWGWGILC